MLKHGPNTACGGNARERAYQANNFAKCNLHPGKGKAEDPYPGHHHVAVSRKGQGNNEALTPGPSPKGRGETDGRYCFSNCTIEVSVVLASPKTIIVLRS